MAHQSSDSNSRMNKRKSKKGKVGRKILLGFVILILLAAGTGAFAYYKLRPQNHFKDLQVVGKTDDSGGGGNPGNVSAKDQPKLKAGVFNMVLLGSDIRKGDSAGHTDSILLIHVNLNDHTYNIMSIPRDTRVHMDGYGYTKLTSVQYISQVHHGTKQGIVDAVQAISDLTGVPINFYAETSYWGLRNMVDAIGGIEMKVPFDVKLTHPWYKEDKGKVIQAGTHHFDGKMVTEIVHERYSLANSDYGRQHLQEEAMLGIIKKIMDPSNVTKLPSLASSLSDFLIATNMSTGDMVSLALGVKGDFHPKQQIHYRQVKGHSESIYDDILQAKNSEIILDKGQLKSVVKKYFKE